LTGDQGITDINDTWTNVTGAVKSLLRDDGRVSADIFAMYFSNKYAAQLTDDAKKQAYATFINSVHTMATKMMLPNIKTTIGQHCFKYAATMAGEFYF